MSGFRIIVSAVLVAFTINCYADNPKNEVGDWLERMVNAVHSMSYEGTFVFLHNDQLESMQIVHTADQTGEKERLVSLNGVAREVFRDNISVTCIAPDVKSVSIGHRTDAHGFQAVFSVDISHLSGMYDFHVLGEARVAGRITKVVSIIPKDSFRYGYRIYLDTENALPLKTDMLNVSGKTVSQLMFTQLQVNTSGREISEIPLDGKEYYHWEQQKPMQTIQDQKTSRWSFTDLPKGFMITLHSKSKAKQEGGDVDHFVLSDGLASLSVYVEKAADADLRGSATMGTINAFGNELNGYHVTAVGEVPAVTVEQIARSLKLSR